MSEQRLQGKAHKPGNVRIYAQAVFRGTMLAAYAPRIPAAFEAFTVVASGS